MRRAKISASNQSSPSSEPAPVESSSPWRPRSAACPWCYSKVAIGTSIRRCRSFPRLRSGIPTAMLPSPWRFGARWEGPALSGGVVACPMTGWTSRSGRTCASRPGRLVTRTCKATFSGHATGWFAAGLPSALPSFPICRAGSCPASWTARSSAQTWNAGRCRPTLAERMSSTWNGHRLSGS